MLEEECQSAGVSIFLNAKILDVSRTTEFVVRASNAEFHAPALVVATGGLSIPKIGATSYGYDLARQFGLNIREPWPGLVPLVLEEQDRSRYCNLTGVSADVVASCDGQQFREKMLITHRGLSGPAILQISSYWKKPREIHIDLAPGTELTAIFRDPKTPRTPTALRSEFRKTLPTRLADRWLELHPPTSWTNTALADLEQQAHCLDHHAREHRRLREGRSDRRRRRHRRTLSQDDGKPQSSGSVFHRRSRRRDRSPRRLQLSVGLGLRRGGRQSIVNYAPQKSGGKP